MTTLDAKPQTTAEILRGRSWNQCGTALVDGIPVTTEAVAGRALGTLSESLGTLLPQDDTGQTIRKVRYRGLAIGEGATGRYSDSREGGNLHTDGPHRDAPPPDAFALLCVRQSTIGGELLLVESDHVVAALDPDTIEILQQPFSFDQREHGSTPVSRRILRRGDDGHWHFAYLRRYLELGHTHPGTQPLTPRQRRALDQLDKVLDRLAGDTEGHRRIKLRPGQAVIVDNRRLLHGRTAFADRDEGPGRLMLRSWIRLAPRPAAVRRRPR